MIPRNSPRVNVSDLASPLSAGRVRPAVLPLEGLECGTLPKFAISSEDDQAIFADINLPLILTHTYVLYFTNCTSQLLTASATVFIDNSAFFAESVILTFTSPADPLTPVFYAFTYPSVTITSLTVGEILTVVFLAML